MLLPIFFSVFARSNSNTSPVVSGKGIPCGFKRTEKGRRVGYCLLEATITGGWVDTADKG